MKTITSQQKKDIKLLGKFVEVYCEAKHCGADRAAVGLPADLEARELCPECASFLEYAVTKRLLCPLEAEKPTCKHCRIHCYDQPRREKVREIMSYVGRRLVMRGRLDYLWHYFF
ncbi:MAG: nitrous oxide-stimulated promoter family protein [Desulfuromonadaceae bacterium]